MPGTVFLSCGQNDRELSIAESVAHLLRAAPFHLEVFVARATNNLLSLNQDVLERLAYADYFVFINFRREDQGFPGSLYSHQELAMALALGHRLLLVYSEKDAPSAGVIQFIVQNRPPFSNKEELLRQVEADVARAGWRPEYSRFLQAREIVEHQGITFTDGVGNCLQGTSISVVVENQSSDLQECVMVTLESVDRSEPGQFFRSPLKVSGQRRYDAAIPAGSSVVFGILMDGTRSCPAAQQSDPGTFLVSALDLSPLPSLFSDEDQHEMVFRIDARARRAIRFKLVRRHGVYVLA